MQDLPLFWHAHQLPLERGSAKGRGGRGGGREKEGLGLLFITLVVDKLGRVHLP